MKKNVVNWGIISTAKIGWEHVIPAIQKSKNSKVLGLASRDLKKAKIFFENGADKILLNTMTYNNKKIVNKIADFFGLSFVELLCVVCS